MGAWSLMSTIIEISFPNFDWLFFRSKGSSFMIALHLILLRDCLLPPLSQIARIERPAMIGGSESRFAIVFAFHQE